MRRRRKGKAGLGNERGASALELLMTMGVIFFLLFSIVHVSLIASTRLISNYAAWISARVWAVNEDDATGKAEQAGMAVLSIMEWKPIVSDFINVQPGNEGVEVRYETNLGMPFLLKNDTSERITVRAWGSVPRDPNAFDEKGDNRER